MKFKDFIKSGSLKCILVLLAIALVCGTILAVANDLFYVSDDEMFARSMSKIYAGDATQLAKVDGAAGKSYTQLGCEGVILDARTSPDGKTYLVQAKGNKCGYSDGSIVLWVSIGVNGTALSGINKVVLDSYDASQSLIGSITEDFLGKYASSENSATVTGGKYFYNSKMSSSSDGGSEVVAAGATFTSRAADAAVNAAMAFVREEVGE